MKYHNVIRLLLVLLPLVLVLTACSQTTPTSVAVANSATPLPPTDIPVSPTATTAPSTSTAIPPTATETSLPPTPTDTQSPPTATNTLIPATAIPRPTATRIPVKAVPPPSDMPASFTDTFDTPGLLRAGSDDICATSYEGGQFHFRVYKQNYFCWAVYPRVYSNFALEVDVTMYSGEGTCGGGADILFGYKDRNNFDLFSVTRDCRAYDVSKLVNGQWQTLRPWDAGLRVGNSPGPGITITHLKLVVQGSEFQLYSGGQLMDKVNDPAYSGGQVGLSGGTFGQDVHTSFDNFVINALP